SKGAPAGDHREVKAFGRRKSGCIVSGNLGAIKYPGDDAYFPVFEWRYFSTDRRDRDFVLGIGQKKGGGTTKEISYVINRRTGNRTALARSRKGVGEGKESRRAPFTVASAFGLAPNTVGQGADQQARCEH